MIAIIPELTENITAPRASPEPFFKANSQKVFAIRYDPRAAVAKSTVLFRDHSLANMSAMSSKVISRLRGNNHFINLVYQKTRYMSSSG